MSAMNTPPRKLLKVAEQQQRHQAGDDTERARSAPATSINFGLIVARLGFVLVDVDAHEVDQRHDGQHDRDCQARAHAEQADGQAAEHRGDCERHAVRRADEAVRLVAPVLWDQEGHRGRQRDGAQVAGDGAREDQR